MPSATGFQVNEILTAANTNTYLLRPYRNAVINGAMQITQRATSATGITNTAGYFTADRWVTSLANAGTWSQTTQALTSSDLPLVDGVRNSTRLTCTTAQASLVPSAYCLIGQRIEGNVVQQFAKGTTNAKHYALSFWVRSNRTGTYIIELFDADNARTVSQAYTITTSGAWQKVQMTLPPDFAGLMDNDNNDSFNVVMWLAAGTDFASGTLRTAWGALTNPARAVGQVNCAGTVNNYFEFTAVQLEPNVVCTPFEVRSTAEMLTACQRYFFRIPTSADYEPVAVSGPSFNNVAYNRTTVILPTPMRKKIVTADVSWSTLVAYDGQGVVFVTTAAVVGNTLGNCMVSMDWNSAGGLLAGRPVVILTQPNSAAFFQVNAEL